MVAYSFQKQFVPKIRQGLKWHTIRAYRKRHARDGELIQLYAGMRTRFCEKIIPDPICTAVLPVQMSFYRGAIERIDVGHVPVCDLDRFAVSDGFEDIGDMAGFWRRQHGLMVSFEGVLIEWIPPDPEQFETENGETP